MPVPSFRRLLHPLIAALLCAATTGVVAQEPPPQGAAARGPDVRASMPRPDNVGRQQARDSMTESVRRIERSTRGRVLNIEQMHSDGRDLNRVKVMDESGRVRIYVDDPNRGGGRPIRARGDDD
ncbi:hypothetical protein LDO31_05465 [Luteimonas sp. XNQY3]|nr:hypothetical protein [Luteimonas sp. XNQY3]MCD9005692.1 hypothetical protein [Luteimonas sp. XNQY3]